MIRRRSQFRAVFDFGSGTTKLALCEKVTSSGPSSSSSAYWHTLFGEERETYVGYDVKRSGAKNAISDETAAIVMQAVSVLVAQIREFEEKSQVQRLSIPACGFATAVYRECSNGRRVLDEVSKTFGFPIHIISQKQEGIAGFLTAAQLSSDVVDSKSERPHSRLPRQHDELLSWDSGGSSFQIALGSFRGGRESIHESDTSSINDNPRSWQLQNILEGPWGNSKVAHYFMKEIHNKTDEQMEIGNATMNPCSAEEFEILINYIKNDLTRKISDLEDDARWLREAVVDRKVPVVTIGGETSAFKLCSVLLQRSYEISPKDLRAAAKEYFFGKMDEDIVNQVVKKEKLGEIRQVHIAVGKLALLAGVMEVFNIPYFSFFQSVGTTNGLAAMEELWESEREDNAAAGNTNNSKL